MTRRRRARLLARTPALLLSLGIPPQQRALLGGGAPLNEEFGKAVGADAYCRDAAIAVETAKGLLAARRAAVRAAAPAAVPA